MTYTPNTYDDPCREDDTVYFTGDSSSESWAGVIGDENDMTDDQVKDYIKNAKPELFVRLRGMRFSSSDIPLTFKPLRDLRRLDGMDTERQDRDLTSQRYTTSREESIGSKKPRSPTQRIQENTSYYGETLQNKIQRQGFREKDEEQNQDQLKLDGVAQRTVLSAAERLYPKIEPAETAPLSFRDKNIKPDHAFNHHPNSKQALDLRALKQLEINETLAEVSKYEKALKAAKSQLRHLDIRSPSPDASVLITRPFYMEPREDRYKKQGLTRWDRAKYSKALRQSNLHSTPTPVKGMSTKMLYCYCREPDNGREMVRCSKQWCPVGWFHLQCTGLDRLPFLNEEFHCCYCSDGLGPLVSDDLLDQGPHRHPEVAAKLVDSVAHHYLDNEIETEVVYEEYDAGQGSTNAPGRISIYDDEDDEGDADASDVTDDGSWAAEEYAKLRDKIVKWQAVNDPYQRSKIDGEALSSADNRTSTTYSTTSFFNDDNDDSDYSQNSGEEGVCLASDTSTIRASSPTAATTKSATSFNDNKENCSDNFYEQDDVAMMDSEMTAIDSAEDGDDEDEADELELTYHGRTVSARNLISDSGSAATTQTPFLPQPSTITDSFRTHMTHSKPGGSPLTSRNGIPSNFPCFNNPTNEHPITDPQTPLLAPQVSPSRSKKPWGTPVNIKDFDLNLGFNVDVVAEPASPSPDKKRKFSEIDDDVRDDVRGRHGGLADDADEREVEDQNGEGEDGDEGSEEEDVVTFMLDPQTP